MNAAECDRLLTIHERQAVAMERIAAVLEQMLPVGTPEPCSHPKTERVDQGSTMGYERWRCSLCGYEHDAPFPSGDT